MSYNFHQGALLPLLHITVEFLANHISASLYFQVPRNLPEARGKDIAVSERTICSSKSDLENS